LWEERDQNSGRYEDECSLRLEVIRVARISSLVQIPSDFEMLR